ncbi:hypothetical protein OAA65_00040 [bacterium]|nr:hypothetical protein [bacterium]
MKNLLKLNNVKRNKILKKNNNFCEECKKEDKSVFQNLILIGFKICNSCRTSKTIFPV